MSDIRVVTHRHDGLAIVSINSLDEFGSDETKLVFSSGKSSVWLPHSINYFDNYGPLHMDPIKLFECQKCQDKMLLLLDRESYLGYKINQDTVLYQWSVAIPNGLVSHLLSDSLNDFYITAKTDEIVYNLSSVQLAKQLEADVFQDENRQPLKREKLVDYDFGDSIRNEIVDASGKFRSQYLIHRVNTYTNDNETDTLRALIDWDSKRYETRYRSKYYNPDFDSIYFVGDTLFFSWATGKRMHVNCAFVHTYSAKFLIDSTYGEAMCISFEERIENGQSCECDGTKYEYIQSKYYPYSLRDFIESFEVDYFTNSSLTKAYSIQSIYDICSDTSRSCLNWLPSSRELRASIQRYPVTHENLDMYEYVATFYKNEADDMPEADFWLRAHIIEEAVRRYKLTLDKE